MAREKFDELRKKRLEEGVLARERFREIRRKKKERPREKKLEEERREKAEDALKRVNAAVAKVEKETNASKHVPDLMRTIGEMLEEADKGLRSAEYEQVTKLSSEIEELAEKAGLEALRKAEEKRRVKEKKRKEEGKFFYCVIPFNEEKSFGKIGLNGEEVYNIPYRNIAAVVSNSPLMEYELTEESARKQQEVTRRVMDEHTVIPVEFGTVTKNEKILRRLMAKAYKAIVECFKMVDNKIELGVKIVLGKDTELLPGEKRTEAISYITESLKSKAADFKDGTLFSNRLLLNSSYLVEKDDMDLFSEEVGSLQEKYPMLKFLYSGPWAPHNFVYIKIGSEGMTITRK